MTFTFSSMKTAVKAVAEDDGAEFEAYYETALMLAQSRITRNLDSLGFQVIAATSVSGGDMFITKPNIPNATRVVKSLVFSWADETSTTALEKKTTEFIRDYWPTRTALGTPKFYADWDASTVIIAPTPSVNIDVEMEVVAQPSVLASSTQETNWFTDFVSDMLFYATMKEMARFSKNVEAKQDWEESYQESLAAYLVEADRTRREDAADPAAGSGENNIGG
jgi:hypothetical protein